MAFKVGQKVIYTARDGDKQNTLLSLCNGREGVIGSIPRTAPYLAEVDFGGSLINIIVEMTELSAA